MIEPKSPRRRPALWQALLWFVPGWAAVAIAALGAHPLTLIPLLAAQTLTMAAVCHAIGFDPEPRFLRTVLRRGAAHLVLLVAYVALLFVLIAGPMLWLHRAPSLGAALALATAMVVALVALWRVWPAFGLLFVWDDAYPAQSDGSWIFTAMARSLAFGRHLAREERFFTHFLPAALALLMLAFTALVLAGLYGVLPDELRTAALVAYGLVLLPVGCLVIANRTLRALLCERQRPSRRAARAPAAATTEVATLAALAPAARDAALLEAARGGDVERALALLEAGADPDAVPAADARDRRSALVLAALLPDTRLLRALIVRGARVNAAAGGLTALLAATRDSWHGRAEAVLTLLSNGADPALADARGVTPLHGAALCADAGIAAMLIDAGAPLDAQDAEGVTPLVAACRAANWPLARFLLARGAQPMPAGGEPALHAAATIAEDDPQGVRLLLERRVAVNARDAQGRSALQLAAGEGHALIVGALLAAGADPNQTDDHGRTALMEAAAVGAGDVAAALLEAGADVRARDGRGQDALALACQSSRASLALVGALIARGADPALVDADGRSARDHAATAGRWDLVALLDPHAPQPSEPHGADAADGHDAEHLLDALRFGHWTTVAGFATVVGGWPQETLARLFLELAAADAGAARQWLLRHGLQAEARLPAVDGALGPRLFDALLERLPASRAALGEVLDAGASPAGGSLFARLLARAGAAADDALTRACLERGADAFGAEADGRTPLHLAAHSGRAALLEDLLERGADPNARDARGRTPLMAALAHGDAALPLVRALIAHGADAEAADMHGETPLGRALEHAAVQRWLDWGDWPRPRRPLRAEDLPAAARAGAGPAVERLLELGFPVDTRDAQGASALLHAAGAGHRDIAVRLLAAGADPAQTSTRGVSALAAAVMARREALVDTLLAAGAPVDQRLPGGATALILAAGLGHAGLVERLLAAGADLAAADEAGHTALHAAARYAFEASDSLRARRLFDVLLRHGAAVDVVDSDGMTPLLLLLGAHQRPGNDGDPTHLGALVPVLLDAGADLRRADRRGVGPLHACAMHALLAPARVLLARGAERAAVDAFGRTAADVARQLGYIDIAHELAARHAPPAPSVRQTLRQPARPAE